MTSPSDPVDVLVTTSAHTHLALPPEHAWALVERLAEQWWPSRVVVAAAPRLLVHAVGADTADDPDGWLSWTFDEPSPGTTRLTVGLSELADGAPAPELDDLLDRIASHSTEPHTHPRKDPS